MTVSRCSNNYGPNQVPEKRIPLMIVNCLNDRPLPETGFTDGIKKTIRRYLDNRNWWKTIISGECRDYCEKMYGNR